MKNRFLPKLCHEDIAKGIRGLASAWLSRTLSVPASLGLGYHLLIWNIQDPRQNLWQRDPPDRLPQEQQASNYLCRVSPETRYPSQEDSEMMKIFGWSWRWQNVLFIVVILIPNVKLKLLHRATLHTESDNQYITYISNLVYISYITEKGGLHWYVVINGRIGLIYLHKKLLSKK